MLCDQSKRIDIFNKSRTRDDRFRRRYDVSSCSSRSAKLTELLKGAGVYPRPLALCFWSKSFPKGFNFYNVRPLTRRMYEFTSHLTFIDDCKPCVDLSWKRRRG